MPTPLRKFAALGRHFRRPRLNDLVFLGGLWLIGLALALAALLLLSRQAEAAALSRGDRLALIVSDGDAFAGHYQVDQHGALVLPYLGSLSVLGLEPRSAARQIAQALEQAHYFQAGRARVSMQVLDWASIEVFVEGEVNQPGRVRLNLPPVGDRLPAPRPDLPGAAMPERRLSDALRAAGGIRPTAKLDQVTVSRDGRRRSFDLRGLLSGAPGTDPQLVDGDRIRVPSSGSSDPALARPSALTPAGIRLYVSNLTTPAFNNNAATMERGSVALPYGARLSQAVVAANCVGGIGATNAGRHALLVRTERSSGQTRRWRAAVEDILEGGDARINPLLLEGDALACYDSGVTSLRDVLRAIFEVLLPLRVLQ